MVESCQPGVDGLIACSWLHTRSLSSIILPIIIIFSIAESLSSSIQYSSRALSQRARFACREEVVTD